MQKTNKEIIEEGKAKLKSKLNEKVALLKTQCKDAHFFDSVMEDVLSIKGQLDVEPTRIFVREEDLIEEWDCGSFKLSRFTTGIAFHMMGYDFFVNPTCQTLYGQLDFLFKSKGKYNALTQEQKEIHDALFSATMDIILTPPMCFCDDSYYIDIATYIMKRRNQLFKELDERPLAPETIADEQFMSNVDLGEQLKESITKAVEDEI